MDSFHKRKERYWQDRRAGALFADALAHAIACAIVVQQIKGCGGTEKSGTLCQGCNCDEIARR